MKKYDVIIKLMLDPSGDTNRDKPKLKRFNFVVKAENERTAIEQAEKLIPEAYCHLSTWNHKATEVVLPEQALLVAKPLKEGIEKGQSQVLQSTGTPPPPPAPRKAKVIMVGKNVILADEFIESVIKFIRTRNSSYLSTPIADLIEEFKKENEDIFNQ